MLGPVLSTLHTLHGLDELSLYNCLWLSLLSAPFRKRTLRHREVTAVSDLARTVRQPATQPVALTMRKTNTY